MENFVLENPTKIIFGKGTVGTIGREAKQLGTKILFLYGQKSIKNNGVYDEVLASLNGSGISHIVEHGGVKSNPLLSHVRQGIKLVQKDNLDCIVAVGGGSVIDSAKAISAGALVEHDVWQFFKGKKSIKKSLPIATVLTLPASASEMNSGMVITNDDTGYKLGIGNKLLFPKVSILDPTVTYTIPPNYTAYGAVDAIAHILEFYCTCKSPDTPVQERFMEGLIINIIENCNRTLQKGNDYSARANLMWCATLALNGWTAAGLGKVGFPMHMIEHSLSAIYDCPHGAGLSVVIPAWLTWRRKTHPEKIAQLGERVFGLKSAPVKDQAHQCVNQFRDWFTQIKSPVTLTELGVPSSDIKKIAEHSMVQAKLWRLQKYDTQITEDILNLAQ